ncbi:peptidase inhibitor family I36 protein [Yersinia enterocolitica]|uniref:peptidase inhibitor family I36 protein n=1 Tax=Yersinia enterocolitica TaxID=630 RepID=UPI0029100E76|nr:peptidase inhibitor family I36 protein [Yersinia enterocolitica]EKN5022546.1 exotoxin [Yersinia enterocolitica]EKN5067922.1 exotoxin [Yersinia enterocolitica]EKN5132556.1 exotoxin [Yersinia enterocolitica]HDL6992401.1 peptidase inhibitor family I36 protein [Yersinia enterocolitica]
MVYNVSFIMLFLIILTTNVFAEEPRICFFEDENYQGRSICAHQGQAVSNLKTEWNDKISSIIIPLGMVVTTFKDINFSGENLTFKESVDLGLSRRWTSLNNAISSFKVRSAACFYTNDDFIGESICISGNERLNLYNGTHGRQSHMLNPLNDRISSILLPADTQTIIYENDNYGGIYFTLTESHSASDLEKIGMNNNISSVRTSQFEHFLCDKYCVIKDSMVVPIQYAFGSYWNDKRIGSKQVLISFYITNEDDYAVGIAGGGVFKVKGREVLFVHEKINRNAVFELSDHGNTLSLLSKFNGGYFEFQLIESSGDQVINIYPVLGYLFDVDNTNIKFFIYNKSAGEPVIIDKVVLTVEKAQHRMERSFIGKIVCWLNPMLNLYNYIIQGGCNQVDHFITDARGFFSSTDNKVLQVSGTSKPLPKIKDNESFAFDKMMLVPSSDPKGILTHINSDMNGKSLTLPATALACHVSMKDQILPHLRSRRETIPPCITWTLNILTDFTLLFGSSISTWNAENFGRVISRIVNTGDTGYAVSDPTVDERFVENVRTFIAANIDNVALLKTAFDFSQLSYSDYLRHNKSESGTQSPQAVQLLPQGRYELALQNFQFVATVPRRQHHGEWVEHPELHFDIEIISGETAATQTARQNVVPVVEDWRKRYRQVSQSLYITANAETTSNPNMHHGMNDVISAASLVSDVAQSWLRTPREDYIYVIVRLAGEIVSIAMAVDINEFDVGVAGSLTRPDDVLYPTANGVIRGAGTAAMRALAEHVAKKGKRALVSEVISQPSAIVKKKLGFQYINEL